jgi:hypothetical protein
VRKEELGSARKGKAVTVQKTKSKVSVSRPFRDPLNRTEGGVSVTLLPRPAGPFARPLIPASLQDASGSSPHRRVPPCTAAQATAGLERWQKKRLLAAAM